MFVIGTAGHVDHGKSALVHALTGIDPDRLAEEKARGMTIDLGFAWLELPSGREASIVDVPGHERFIKNMLAGAGGVDVALLVVAADDGVMPQTREHLAILDLLGVSRGVVVLTKCDLVEESWLSLVEADIIELVEPTTLAGSPVVRCSALAGVGLDHVRTALDAAGAALPSRRDAGRPRLSIDRVFTIAGFGTVVTGTLIDGELAAGDEVEVSPCGVRARIRGLQSHGQPVARARPGTRTAVNLAGVERDGLRRGMMLARPGTVRPTQIVDARVRSVRSLRHNARLSFHCLAAETAAHLRLLESDALAAGSEASAQLKLATPLALAPGDRFVLRSPDDTVGGGVVIATDARRYRRRDGAAIARLAAAAHGGPRERLRALLAQRPLASAAEIARDTAMSDAECNAALQSLVQTAEAVPFSTPDGSRYAASNWVDAVQSRSLDALAAYHQRHPLRGGMPREELRSRLGLDARAFAAVASRWEGVRIEAGLAALAAFSPQPSPAQCAAIERYLVSLRASLFHATGDDAMEPELLRYLIASAQVVDAGGMLVEAQVFADMRSRIEQHITRHGAITLAQARDVLGTGRKHAQAILEELDRRGVTLRRGDERVLR